MGSEFVLLVKLEAKNVKLSFPKKPKIADVVSELRKQAKIGSELDIVLSAPDPDFPTGGDVVLGADAELKSKQVLSALTQLKEVQSWEQVDCPERGKALLKDNGISPSVAHCLVHMLGYSDPNDLEHVTEALLSKLPLKPLEKTRLTKLVETAKITCGGSPARPPSSRFTAKTSTPSSPTTPKVAAATPAATSSPSKTTTAAKTFASKPAASGTKSVASTDKKAAAAPAADPEPEPEPAPAPPPAPYRPPADEDEDEMLQRILAEGEADKPQATGQVLASAGNFSNPISKTELVATLEGHKDSVLALAITPDNATLFTASGDNTIMVWSLKGYFLTQTLTDHSTSVGVLVLTADGMHLISGSGDGAVIVWDVIAGKVTKSFEDTESHAYGILAMTLANKSPLLFTATGDKKIRGFAIGYKKKTLTLAMEMTGHLESVRSMVVSPDDSVLYSASEDATIKVWNADKDVGYKFIQALRGHEAAVYGLAMSRDGTTLISCSADKTITVWRIKPTARDPLPDGPVIQQVLTGHKGDVNCVVLNESGNKLFSSGDDKTVRVWGLLAPQGKAKVTPYALQQTLEGHALIVYPIAVSRDGRVVASGSADNTARVWSLLNSE